MQLPRDARPTKNQWQKREVGRSVGIVGHLKRSQSHNLSQQNEPLDLNTHPLTPGSPSLSSRSAHCPLHLRALVGNPLSLNSPGPSTHPDISLVSSQSLLSTSTNNQLRFPKPLSVNL